MRFQSTRKSESERVISEVKQINLAKSLFILSLFLISTMITWGLPLGNAWNQTSLSTFNGESVNAPWAFQMQNQQNTGYSPQTIVNSSDVSSLRSLWNASLPGLTGTPVISNGIVYLTSDGSIAAVDESSGRVIWIVGEENISQVITTRVGVTIDRGNIFAGTENNELVSLNALTGALNWQASIVANVTGSIADYQGPQETPLVFNGKIILGENLGDNGARGLVRAFNESDGSLLWTYYTVPPAPMNSTNQQGYLGLDGSESWGTNGTTGCMCGGGAVWNVPALDPRTGIIYFGTGNPYPFQSLTRSPNSSFCNLWTDSVLAVNSTNGHLIWGFQEYCDDQYDLDQGMPVQLFNTTIEGEQAEVVGAGGKSGFYFELNALTGALIYKVKLVIHLNDNQTPPGFKGIIYPASNGGVNTFASYYPATNMIYVSANNQPKNCPTCQVNSTLYAIDASSGSVVWNLNQSLIAGGVSSTNTVVFVSGNHTLYALDGKTGAVLWQYHDVSGNDGYRWSWGAPSITDGYVFETTWGTKGHGHLEAFALTNTIDFVEQGLQPGTLWSVKFEGKWYFGTTQNISISSVFSGKYNWKVNGTLPIGDGIRYEAMQAYGSIDVPLQVTVNINYSIQYRVVVKAAKTGGGSTIPNGPAWYNSGSSHSISADPNLGHKFVKWQVSMGTKIIIENITSPMTFAQLEGPGTILAKFKSV